MHTVQNPFYCWEGQFKPGEKSLSIGVDLSALAAKDLYQVMVGKETGFYYEVESAKAIEFANRRKSIWKNKKGRRVAILPLFIFKVIHTDGVVEAPVVTEAPPKPQLSLFDLST